MEKPSTEMQQTNKKSERYNRYCRQMDKEDKLIDQRTRWLLVSQSILFAALKIGGQDATEITSVVVPAVGAGSSFLIGISILAALISFLRYRSNLRESFSPKEDPDFEYPQLHRSRINISMGLVAPATLPIIFCAAWVYMLCLR